MEWRNLKLEGGVAAAQGTPILTLASGASALEHAGENDSRSAAG